MLVMIPSVHKKRVVKQAGKGQEAPTLPYFLLITCIIECSVVPGSVLSFLYMLPSFTFIAAL